MENTERKYEAIFCIINAGFSDDVMFAARKAGAAGGTIIKGRGTAPREAEKMFNIAIQPEKEIVMLLVPEDIKDNVLRELYHSAGISNAGQGIIFSLPVDRALGLSDFSDKKEAKPEDPEE
jgi:nitrogen regulatory protein PII